MCDVFTIPYGTYDHFYIQHHWHSTTVKEPKRALQRILTFFTVYGVLLFTFIALHDAHLALHATRISVCYDRFQQLS